MNDIFLVLAGIAFLFVVWLYNGGPHNPISFAGPYITPITDVGARQIGYGDDISANSFSASGNSFWGSWSAWSGSDSSDVPAANRSPYAGTVRLDGGDADSTEPREEYVTVESSSDNVNITGWQLVSKETGSHAVIPGGVQIADYGQKENSIILNDGDRAIIVSGRSTLDESFRETECTGYLDEHDRFTPSLSQSCPSPSDELGQFYSGNTDRYDQCSEYVSRLSSCEVPTDHPDSDVPNSCLNFVDERLSYKGCVSGHRNDADFNLDTWRVFLDSSKQLWRESNDTIELLDATGKVVDQYSY